MHACLLCHSRQVQEFYKDEKHHFLKCGACTTVFRNPKTFLSETAEKERYLTHNNDVEDIGYQHFVSPIVSSVISDFTNSATGLDFGAGTGPVISKLLLEKGYAVALYDPFFHPDTASLLGTYDFIVCCEVIEHFHSPLQEFQLLKTLLKPNGKLYCMTHLLNDTIDFKNWYYKNDPTHVLFYSEGNLNFIKDKVGFSKVEIDNRLIVFN